MEFHGVQMKKGDAVLMPGYFASRDERQYDDPHRVDPDRKSRHLSLATGIHNCLGSHLAKREIKIVLEEWLSRFNNIRMVEGKPQRWDATGVWAMTELWLEWD
jgi:cytochrome P450